MGFYRDLGLSLKEQVGYSVQFWAFFVESYNGT